MSGLTFSPVKSKPKRRRIVVYDLEWIPETMHLTLAGTYDGSQYRSFETVNGLLNELLSDRYRGAFIYAHAGGIADMPFLLEQLCENRKYHIEASFSGSSAVVVRVQKAHGTKEDEWIFLDSYWLLRDKLDHLAKSIGERKTGDTWHCATFPDCGHRKAKEDICSDAPECGCPDLSSASRCMFYAPNYILEEYNRNDCMVLWKAISRFQDEILMMGGELMLTIASTAMRLFRRKYLKSPIITSPLLSDEIRPAYIASRVEPYRSEGFNLTEFDINSSFPFAMTFPTPGSLLSKEERRPYGGKDIVYYARAKVNVPDSFLPPLPYRCRRDDRIYFPTGTWTGLFSQTDLNLLEEAGGDILSFNECWIFEARTDFADYATDLYELRKNEKDQFRKLLLKYLLNSCYGKTAEGRDKSSLVVHPQYSMCPHDGKHDFVDENDQIVSTCILELFPGAILLSDEKAIPHEHVPIAAEITAIARRTLYQFAIQCGDDLYYSDTDSLYTHHDFPSSAELGGLKKSKGVYHGEFLAAKLYKTDDKIKSKGFGRMSVATFECVKRGEPFEFERQSRIREMARKGRIFPESKILHKQLRLDRTRPKRHMVPGDHPSTPWNVRQVEEKWVPEKTEKPLLGPLMAAGA
jgi:hypothetical protein